MSEDTKFTTGDKVRIKDIPIGTAHNGTTYCSEKSKALPQDTIHTIRFGHNGNYGVWPVESSLIDNVCCLMSEDWLELVEEKKDDNEYNLQHVTSNGMSKVDEMLNLAREYTYEFYISSAIFHAQLSEMIDDMTIDHVERAISYLNMALDMLTCGDGDE